MICLFQMKHSLSFSALFLSRKIWYLSLNDKLSNNWAIFMFRLCLTWDNYLHLINAMKGWVWQQAVKQDVESLTNSEMSSIAKLPSVNHLKSAIRDIRIWCLQVTMEAGPKTPLIWQAFTKWHATGLSVSIGLPWLLGLWVGRSTLHGVVTAINYAIQCISVSRY